MIVEREPGHGGNGGLCFEDHICPPCERGEPCMDLFVHPICGTVACNADEAKPTPRGWPENTYPTPAELADWLGRCTAAERLEFAGDALSASTKAWACFMERHVGEIDDLRSQVRRVIFLLADGCRHCGSAPDPDGDHSCPCPHSDGECIEHAVRPVMPDGLYEAVLGVRP